MKTLAEVKKFVTENNLAIDLQSFYGKDKPVYLVSSEKLTFFSYHPCYFFHSGKTVNGDIIPPYLLASELKPFPMSNHPKFNIMPFLILGKTNKISIQGEWHSIEIDDPDNIILLKCNLEGYNKFNEFYHKSVPVAQ